MAVVQQIGTGLREQLGDILVRKRRLTRHELNQAVVEAPLRNQRLGEYLLSIGAVYEDDVAQALAEQYCLRYVAIDPRALDQTTADLIPESIAERLVMLPLHRSGETIVVAVADPTNIFATDELQMLVGRDIEFVVSERSALEAGIRALYAAQPVWAPEEPPPAQSAARAAAAIDAAFDDESAPAVEAVNSTLRRAIELGASDVHWIPRTEDLLVRVRIDGVMRDLDVIPLDFRAAVTARLKVMAQLDIAERRLPQDGRVAITLDGVAMDLRTAVLPSTHGEEVVLRIAYVGRNGNTRLSDLNLDDETSAVLTHALEQPSGAILIAGPTGSGKTTTLYAAVAHLNDGSRAIVSIEDPVEADVDGIVQIEVNTRSGLTFASGLRTILRADPDVIFVGEIRDAETAAIALQAATTGHLVLSTIHAQTAAAGLVRLRQLGIDPTMIGTAVTCVASQRLLRRPCQHCAAGSNGKPRARRHCTACDETRYNGRTGVFEALAMTDAVRHALDSSAAEIEEIAVGEGMRRLRDVAAALADTGSTTHEEVRRVCGKPPRVDA